MVFTVIIAVVCIVCCAIVVIRSLCKGPGSRGSRNRSFSIDSVASRRRSVTIDRDSNNFDMNSGRCRATCRRGRLTRPARRTTTATRRDGPRILRGVRDTVRGGVRRIGAACSSPVCSRRLGGAVVTHNLHRGKHSVIGIRSLGGRV